MGKKRIYKTGYVIVYLDSKCKIKDTLDATFDRATAEEMAMEYSYEWLWRRWYHAVHRGRWVDPMKELMVGKASHAPIEIREIKWYE